MAAALTDSPSRMPLQALAFFAAAIKWPPLPLPLMPRRWQTRAGTHSLLRSASFFSNFVKSSGLDGLVPFTSLLLGLGVLRFIVIRVSAGLNIIGSSSDFCKGVNKVKSLTILCPFPPLVATCLAADVEDLARTFSWFSSTTIVMHLSSLRSTHPRRLNSSCYFVRPSLKFNHHHHLHIIYVE